MECLDRKKSQTLAYIGPANYANMSVGQAIRLGLCMIEFGIHKVWALNSLLCVYTRCF